MICPKCNNDINDESAFCPHCGAELNAANPQAEQPQAMPHTSRPNTTFDPENAARYYNSGAYPPPVSPVPTADEPVSVGMWIGIFLINLIPCIGFIAYIVLMFVWAFGSTPKKSLKTFARAQLILFLIVIGISIVLLLFGALTGRMIFNSVRPENLFPFHNGMEGFNF